MEGKQIKQDSLDYNLHSWSVQGQLDPMVVQKAEGIFIWDDKGNKYYDMTSQLVNVNIGHGNKKVIQAIKDQLDVLQYISPPYAVESRSAAAKKVIEVAPSNMAKVFFTSGGAESNENAMKIARFFTGKYKIFSANRSYHGATAGASAATGDHRRLASEPGATGFVKFNAPIMYRPYFPYKNEQELSDVHLAMLRDQIIFEGPETIAAIIQEPIVGANGIVIPPDGWMQGVRKLCDEFGIVMISDEVMAGFGRTGKWFGLDHWNVQADLITFAKGVNSGYIQLGGVIVSEKISKYFDTNPLVAGLTYSAHPVACASAVASLEVVQEEKLVENAAQLELVLRGILEELKEKHACVGDVRCKGLFSGIELVKSKKTKEPYVSYRYDKEGKMKKIFAMARERGVLTFGRDNTMILAPPLIITEAQLREALVVIDEVLNEVDKEL